MPDISLHQMNIYTSYDVVLVTDDSYFNFDTTEKSAFLMFPVYDIGIFLLMTGVLKITLETLHS